MQQRKSNASGVAMQASAPPETTTPVSFNISLTKVQALALDDLYQYYTLPEINHKLDTIFWSAMADPAGTPGTEEFHVLLMIRRIVNELSPLYKQLNP